MSQSNPTSQKRLSHCFLCNCAFLVFMVAAGFVNSLRPIQIPSTQLR